MRRLLLLTLICWGAGTVWAGPPEDVEGKPLLHPGANLLTYSSDGKLLATAGKGKIKIWDCESGKLVSEFEFLGSPHVMSFVDKNESLFAAITGVRSYVHRVSDGKFISKARMPPSPDAVAITDKVMVAVEAHDGWFGVHDLDAGRSWELHPKRPEQFADRRGRHEPVAVSSDGKRVAYAASNQFIRVIDIKTGELLHTMQTKGYHVIHVAFAQRGNVLGYTDFKHLCVECLDCGMEHKIPLDKLGKALALDPTGTRASVLSRDGRLRHYDLWGRGD